MSANRFIEQEKIRKSFFLPIGIPESRRIYFVNGIFGVGKSWFVRNFIDEVLEKKVVDALCFFDGDYQLTNIYDFVKTMTVNYKSAHDTQNSILFSECDYNITRFNELIEILKEKDISLTNDILLRTSLISESDYLFEDSKSIKHTFDEQLLEKHIDKKGDIRLMADAFRVSVEALIVDLMNMYFPWENVGDDFERFYSESEPVKILFVFDNIESFDYSLNKWLSEYFLEFCCEKKFSDFISYNISYIKDETKISKYLDLRFIISSREDYFVNKDFEYCWEKYETITGLLKLEPLNENNLQDLFDYLKVTINQPNSDIIELTKGLPLLLMKYIEYFDSTGTEQLRLPICETAFNSITKGLSTQEIHWLKCASFLEDFNEKGLRLFDETGTGYKSAYLFLKNKNSISEYNNSTDKINIKNVIKEFSAEYIKNIQPEFYEDCTERAIVYKNTFDVLDRINVDDLNVVRSFAYFKAFNNESAIEDTFQTDVHLAKEYILNHPECFVNNKTTCSLKSNLAQKLDEYNKVVDGRKYELKKQLIKDSWSKYSDELNKKISEFSTELEHLKSESAELDEGIKVSRQEYDKDQTDFFETENSLIEMRRETLIFTKKSNISAGIICLVLTIILIVVTNYFPDMFKDLNSGNKELYDILYISSYSFSILFGILTIVYFIKEINVLTRKDEYRQLKEEIIILEEENSQRQTRMRANKELRSDSETKLSEMTVKKKLLESEIENINMKLEEPFI
jgi:hypothetical protein